MSTASDTAIGRHREKKCEMEVEGTTPGHECFATRVESAFGNLVAHAGHVGGVPHVGGWTVNAAPPMARPGKTEEEGESEDEEWECEIDDVENGTDAEVAVLRRAVGSCRQLDGEDEYDEHDAMATGNVQRNEEGMKRMVVDDSHVEQGSWRSLQGSDEGLIDVSEDEPTSAGKKVRFSEKVEVREYTPQNWDDEIDLWNEDSSGNVVPDHVSNPQKYLHYLMDWSDEGQDEAQEQAEAFLSFRRTILKIKSSEGEGGAACLTLEDGPIFNTKVLPSKRPVGNEPAEIPKRPKASSAPIRLCIEDET